MGHIILITGATSGIGRHAALHFARQGHRVFATGRREAALGALAAEAAGTALETLRLDVTDAASIEAARAEIERRTGGYGVDVLINNAGYAVLGPMDSVDLGDVRAMYETNVFGLVAMTKAFVEPMRRRRSGRILNVSSVGGRATFPFIGAYTSTKYAVESLSDAMRIELAPFGIRVVLIEPGGISTEFNDVAMGSLARPELRDGPYGAVVAMADRVRVELERTSAGPEVVTRAMEKAITRRRPAARYVVPFSAKLLVQLAAIVPTAIVDAIVGGVLGMGLGRPISSDRSITAT